MFNFILIIILTYNLNMKMILFTMLLSVCISEEVNLGGGRVLDESI